MTMTQTPNDDRAVPEYDPEPDIQFRGQPQVAALVTLALGLFSFLACFNTMFWSVPILTVILGPISLFTLARNPDKIGRKAALTGMFLAILVGSFTVTRHLSRQGWLAGEARQCADTWLERIQQNKLHEAHQLHLPQPQRAATGVSLEKHYNNGQPPLQEGFEGFYGAAPMKKLVEVAAAAKFEFVGRVGYRPDVSHDDVVLRYLARYKEDGEAKQLKMDICMRRSPETDDGMGSWHVYEVMEADPSQQ